MAEPNLASMQLTLVVTADTPPIGPLANGQHAIDKTWNDFIARPAAEHAGGVGRA
jgi:hypothetical protein